MESVYKLAKFKYECGSYSATTSYLYFYLLVMPPTDKVSNISISSHSQIIVQNLTLAYIFVELPERLVGQIGGRNSRPKLGIRVRRFEQIEGLHRRQ